MNVSLLRRKALTDIVDDREFWAELRAEIVPLVESLFREMFAAGALIGTHRQAVKQEGDIGDALADAVADEIGDGLPELTFDPEAINARAERFIEQYTNEWWDAMESNTRRSLRTAIQKAQSQGLGVQAVSDSISKLFSPARAMRIATSELTNLLGAGQQATYAEAGFAFWVWETVKDARVDPICDDLQGQQFPMSRLFEKAHVNCRCHPRPAGEVTDMVQPLGSPSPLGTFAGLN